MSIETDINLEISISYWFQGEDVEHCLQLSPPEYFDLDDRELPDIESVPIYDHAIEYVSECDRPVGATLLTISDSNTGRKLMIQEGFWCNGENCIIRRQDFENCQLTYEETIQDLLVEKEPECRRITRVGWHLGRPIIFSDVNITRKIDGTEVEINNLSKGAGCEN